MPPPIPAWYQGRDAIHTLVRRTIFAGQGRGRWRLLPAHANAQVAFGLYRLGPEGRHLAYGLQVVTFLGAEVSDIITFRTPALFDRFDLPPVLPA